LINGGSSTTVMTYKLDDERRLGYPLAFSTSLIPMKIAKRLGGKAYTAGMFLTDESEALFNKDRLKEIYQYKKENDPLNILNPGKVFPRSLDKNTPLALSG